MQGWGRGDLGESVSFIVRDCHLLPFVQNAQLPNQTFTWRRKVLDVALHAAVSLHVHCIGGE